MIRTDASGLPFISLGRSSALNRAIVPGSVVRVDIVGKQAGRDTLVRIAGHVFTASGLAGQEVGESFRARVSFTGDTIYLQPLPSESTTLPPDIFERLGLVENNNSAFLVVFFQKIGARLDGRTMNSLVRLASRFPGREQRAVEAAAILSERGIEPTFDSVERLIRCIEGRSGMGTSDEGNDGTNDKDRDFTAFVNQKKGCERHWIILPFRKVVSGQACSGSVRFLLDIPSGTCLESRITFIADKNEWEFELSKSSCQFTANPPFKSVIFDKFVVYLRSLFSDFGISDISWKYPDTIQNPVTGSVDVEI